MTAALEPRFKVGDHVKDISLNGQGFTGTIVGVMWDESDGHYSYRLRYDADTSESGWWPEDDYVPTGKTVEVPVELTLTDGEFSVEVGEKWPRQKLLEEAISLTCGDRNAQYGSPTQDFERSAKILNAMGYRAQNQGRYALRPLDGHDIALIVAAVKMSRIAWNPEKRDSWVDLAGYAACGWENVERELREDATP